MASEFNSQQESSSSPLPTETQLPSLTSIPHQSNQDDLTPTPNSPTVERRPNRRRKKIASKDNNASSDSNQNTSSNNLNDNNNDPPTSILLPPHIKLPITIQFLFVPSLNHPVSNSNYPHKIQNHHHVSKTTPLFSYFDGETNRPIREINQNNHSLSTQGKNLTSTEINNSHQNQSSSINNRLSDPILDAADSVPDLKTFESPVKGETIEWCISEAQVLRESDGWRSRPLVKIKEPCTHAVQWHGQCAICGSDLTIGDYTGISDTSRASIPMSHGNSTLTVSVSEAQRLESETRSRLLKAKRLSLIVDLDQTIVHATVDPTVGEWMSDPNNPNWSALQDVSRFRLTDGPDLSYEGCYYYLKQRPGLSEFLHSLADLYEMHVYTMGTRAYADAVCKIIDPTGEIFASRILSRDESGSMTLKSISRLFPVDTSMVVIIDDRGDVWEYSPNLVSVIPYNFFVGIGDINGAFLPPARPLETPSLDFNQSNTASTSDKKEDLPIPTMTVTDHSQDSSSTTQSPSNAEPKPLRPKESVSSSLTESVVSVQGSSKDSMPSSGSSSSSQVSGTLIATTSSTGEMDQQTVENTARSKLIADQVLTRPLKQKQMALQEAQRAQKIDSRKRNSGALPINSSTQGSSNSSSSTVNSSRATTPVAVNPPLPPPPFTSSLDPPLLPPSASSTSRQDAPGFNLSLPDSQEGVPDSSQLTSTNQSTVFPPPVDDISDSSDAHTDLSLLDDLDDDVLERPVLIDKDTELNRLKSILGDIHTGFYSQDSIDQADARDVITALKQDVLRGVHIAFSSLWHMDAICEQQTLWKVAQQFGACCYTSLSSKVTHLVAAKLGTYKVNIALSRPNVEVVRPKWLLDAVTLWRRPVEEEYSWRSTMTPNSMNNNYTEEEEGGGAEGGGEFEEDLGDWGVGMDLADWKEARAEVLAALDESDDETSNASLANYSSDDGDDQRGRTRTRSCSHSHSRKRGRTSTITSSSSSAASFIGGSRESSSSHLPGGIQSITDPLAFVQDDSPLSKRKRMARSRSSKLNLVLAATDLDKEEEEEKQQQQQQQQQKEGEGDKGEEEDGKNDHLDPAGDSLNHESSSGSSTAAAASPGNSVTLPDLSLEEDAFLSALAKEMEDQLVNSS